MIAKRHVSEIDHNLRVAFFRDGGSAIIIQWMDDRGHFHNEYVEAPLALIVQDPTDGYHVIDLRLVEPAGRC